MVHEGYSDVSNICLVIMEEIDSGFDVTLRNGGVRNIAAD